VDSLGTLHKPRKRSLRFYQVHFSQSQKQDRKIAEQNASEFFTRKLNVRHSFDHAHESFFFLGHILGVEFMRRESNANTIADANLAHA
jgi:hypothetical protein